MRVQLVCCVCLLVGQVVANAVPMERRRDRGPKDLSDQPHETPKQEHSPGYDHEAFLGKEEAERFDQLPPKEAKRRLGIIAGKIDEDKDGFISEDELISWIKHVAHRYIYEDAERHWNYNDRDKDNFITWEEYKDSSFGAMEDPDEVYDHHRRLTFGQFLEREERRFVAADQDGDGKLTKDEFANFLHPEEAAHMRDIVVDETIADMDSNGDGYVTLKEYINDLWPQYEQEQAGGKEPDWVKSERENFAKHRDKDGDGRLNKEELGHWVMPEDFDHARAEARHLIYEADINKDGKLTKQEILEHQDLFVGSQATDFGDYLVRHDEF